MRQGCRVRFRTVIKDSYLTPTSMLENTTSLGITSNNSVAMLLEAADPILVVPDCVRVYWAVFGTAE